MRKEIMKGHCLTMMTMMTMIDNVLDHYTYQTRWGQKRTHAKIHPVYIYTSICFKLTYLKKHSAVEHVVLTPERTRALRSYYLHTRNSKYTIYGYKIWIPLGRMESMMCEIKAWPVRIDPQSNSVERHTDGKLYTLAWWPNCNPPTARTSN